MMSLRVIARILLLASLAALFPQTARAQTARMPDQAVDSHALYERRCAMCHPPHAGDFAIKALTRDREGRAIGRKSGFDLEVFLARGHGRLSAGEVRAMVAHLTGILERRFVYHDKCRICHDRAVVLARKRLVMRDGRLTGRYSGCDIAAFLAHHGRPTADEVPVLIDMLTRQLPSLATTTGPRG